MTLWTIDPAHSEVRFKVKHLVVSTVTGQFDAFRATIDASNEDFSDAKISFDADVASIQTSNAQRDEHLKSPDCFDAAAHPKLSFVSTSVKKAPGGKLLVAGDLTMRSVTKPVVLEAEYNGTASPSAAKFASRSRRSSSRHRPSRRRRNRRLTIHRTRGPAGKDPRAGPHAFIAL